MVAMIKLSKSNVIIWLLLGIPRQECLMVLSELLFYLFIYFSCFLFFRRQGFWMITFDRQAGPFQNFGQATGHGHRKKCIVFRPRATPTPRPRPALRLYITTAQQAHAYNTLGYHHLFRLGTLPIIDYLMQ